MCHVNEMIKKSLLRRCCADGRRPWTAPRVSSRGTARYTPARCGVGTLAGSEASEKKKRSPACSRWDAVRPTELHCGFWCSSVLVSAPALPRPP